MEWLKIPARFKAKMLNFYPPFIGANIRVTDCDERLTQIRVEMGLNRWNKNVMGVHFGGSLYAMCDPFYMWILMENLGKEFIIWDKAATIRFRKPGTGIVSATFKIPAECIAAIRTEVMERGKNDYVFSTVVINEADQVVAEVEKTVYVRFNKKGACQAP